MRNQVSNGLTWNRVSTGFVADQCHWLFTLMPYRFLLKVRYNAFPQDSGVCSSFVASAFGVVALHCNPGSCSIYRVYVQRLLRGHALIIRIQAL